MRLPTILRDPEVPMNVCKLLFTFGASFLLQGWQASYAQSASDDAFYSAPSPLPLAEPGAVIRIADLLSSAALPGAARNILVLYHSQSIDGRDIAVSGTIAFPKGEPPANGWPITTWTHGTTGIGPACAPSRDRPDGPEHLFLGVKQAMMNAYVERGYVVVATDYEGLGTPGPHPFLQGVSAGRGAIDIIRAARALDKRISTNYVIVGHSQGGHADLFAAAIGPNYAPELTLKGNVAIAPASHIGETVTAMTMMATPSYALGYAMYVLQSFASNHAEIDLKRILAPNALAHLSETMASCITKTVSEGYWATAIPKAQFVYEADISPVLAVAAQNDPSVLRISAPTLILQGSADDTVKPIWTDEVVRSLCKTGNNVTYTIDPGATHETVVPQAAAEIATWIDARFGNAATIGNCAALPSSAIGPR
jgi:pimeloyl-ACP methyl ester carboxylesterase